MVVVGVVLVACVVVALASPGFREMACLFVFLAGLLLWSPSFFPHYVDFLAVPAALTVAGPRTPCAVRRMRRRRVCQGAPRSRCTRSSASWRAWP